MENCEKIKFSKNPNKAYLCVAQRGRASQGIMIMEFVLNIVIKSGTHLGLVPSFDTLSSIDADFVCFNQKFNYKYFGDSRAEKKRK